MAAPFPSFRILLALCLGLLAFLVVQLYTGTSPDITAEVSNSNLRIAGLTQRSEPRTSKVAPRSREVIPVADEPAARSEVPRPVPAIVKATESASTVSGIRISQISELELSNIQKFLTLDDDQKARLREKFAKELAAGHDVVNIQSLDDDLKTSEAAGSESLRDILGEDAFANYRKARDENAEQGKARKMESSLYYLSRKLSLNTDQESAMLQSMKEADLASSDIEHQINERLSRVVRLDTSATPSDPVAKQALLDEVHKLIEEKLAIRRQTIHNSARGFLTDEQYEALMAVEY